MTRISKKVKSNGAQFPARLHDMMTFTEEQCMDSMTIRWVLSGRGFVIVDANKLMEVLPLFFGQTKYKSFLRQLNMWNFQRCTHGPNKGTYMHPYFVKGKRELCDLMIRQNKKFDTQARTREQEEAAAATKGPRPRVVVTKQSRKRNVDSEDDGIDFATKKRSFTSLNNSHHEQAEDLGFCCCEHANANALASHDCPRHRQELPKKQHMKELEELTLQEHQDDGYNLFRGVTTSSTPHPRVLNTNEGMACIIGGDSMVPYPCSSNIVAGERGSLSPGNFCTSSSSFSAEISTPFSFNTYSSGLPSADWCLSAEGSPLLSLYDLEPLPIDSLSSSSCIPSTNQLRDMMKELLYHGNEIANAGRGGGEAISC